MSSTCTSTSRAAGEQLAGTAPVATGWMLVEQPGPWGPDGLRDSGMDERVTSPLERAAAQHGVRGQLIRRPGRRGHHGRPGVRTVVLAHAGPNAWTEVVELTDDAALADIDPTLTLAPRPPGIGVTARLPLVLVCTHARRDRCCATYGRGIVDVLASLHQDQVWEVSHLGGHRFAGNLLVLPDGLVYGGLDVPAALRTVDLRLAGRLELDHLRGRSGLEPAAQTAEIALRQHLGDDRLGTVAPTSLRPGPGGMTEVELRHTDGTHWLVAVVHEPTGRPRALSCDATDEEDPGRHRTLGIQPL